MDDGQKFCTEKFEKLALKKGEVAAIISSSNGDRHCETEKEILTCYQKEKAHNAAMPDDLKPQSSHHMEVSQQARAAIQDYKTKAGVPFDTPPVNLNEPKNFDNTANDEIYGADIIQFPEL